MTNIFPSLETERLLLRPFAVDDLEFIYQHFSDNDVTRYLLDEEPVSSYAEAQAILDFYLQPGSQTHNRWMIVRKSDARRIGTIGFHKWQPRNRRAEIGYDLTKDCWGQGYMSETMRRVIDFGFGALGLNRLEAIVHPDNVASLHLLEKLSFCKEGLLRDYYYQAGRFHSHWLLSLLKQYCQV